MEEKDPSRLLRDLGRQLAKEADEKIEQLRVILTKYGKCFDNVQNELKKIEG